MLDKNRSHIFSSVELTWGGLGGGQQGGRPLHSDCLMMRGAVMSWPGRSAPLVPHTEARWNWRSAPLVPQTGVSWHGERAPLVPHTAHHPKWATLPALRHTELGK